MSLVMSPVSSKTLKDLSSSSRSIMLLCGEDLKSSQLKKQIGECCITCKNEVSSKKLCVEISVVHVNFSER